eukprot:TRINITY_DN12718_c0_g1_i3.p1 TRINITY_DN12718_c0_g1~~TRINITY_DN12718_c0_g1_i3.p1  ORF type:complete len:287 (+),score=41.08 TRINITY_DN12718_c0_g1_i3:391-1251(+)
MAGTSTGAIQVGLLAGLGNTAEEAEVLTTANDCIHFKKIFPKVIISKGLSVPKFDGTGKTEVLEFFFKDTRMKDCKLPLLMPIYCLDKHEAVLCNDLDHPDLVLAQVINASSAAPTFFPPVRLGDKWYIDGGVFANDPSVVAYIDAWQRWPDHEIRVLSVGTGAADYVIDPHVKSFGALEWFSKGNLIEIMLDTTVSSKQAKALLGINYFRANAHLLTAGCKEDMDNRKPKNIERLKTLGRLLWNQEGYHALDLITRKGLKTAGPGLRRIGLDADPASKIFVWDTN